MSEVRTLGVASPVFDEDRVEVGHVVMAEYDETARAHVEQDARRLDGAVVVCRSSPRSWHLWGLRPRSWGEAIGRTDDLDATQHYVEEMDRRGRATLRTHPKVDPDGATVATAPVPVVVEDGEGPVSRPHVERLRQMARHADATDAARDLAALLDGETVGETLRSEAFAYEVGR